MWFVRRLLTLLDIEFFGFNFFIVGRFRRVIFRRAFLEYTLMFLGVFRRAIWPWFASFPCAHYSTLS